MGRPPCYGVPAFRFTKAEVVVMETMMKENNNETPDLQILEAVARKFSESEDRKGKVAVQTKQVWHWFQNKRYAIRAKLKKSSPCPSKISRPVFRFFTAEIAEMERILQEHNNAMPSFEILVELAKRFSESPDRKDHTLIKGKQVWNWFNNRRHNVYAKLNNHGDKFDVSPITMGVPNLMRSVPQPSNSHLSASMLVPIPAPAPKCGPARTSSAFKYASSFGLEFPSLKTMPRSVPVPGPAPAPTLNSTSPEPLLPTSMPVPTLMPAPASAPGPAPALDSTSALAVRRGLEKICKEFEAKSSRHGAWHIVASFLSHRYSVMGDPEVLVRFAVSGEEDEWVDVCKNVRLRSLTRKSKEYVPC